MGQTSPEKKQAWVKRQLDKDPEHHRWRAIKQRYGLTKEQYNEMFMKQDGKCAICKKHQTELTKSLCVDHDHKTGAVRGLLCYSCNTILGQADDNIVLLQAAINYLR
jgi:hypothetical protein